MRTLFSLTMLFALTTWHAADAQSGNAPFCLQASTRLSCSYATMGECEQAKGPADQCITRADTHGTTGLGERPANLPAPPKQPSPSPER